MSRAVPPALSPQMIPVIKVGFTGTSRGMTPYQKAQVRERLQQIQQIWDNALIEFHHGLCIGGDEQAAEIAKELGCRIVAHPGFNPRNPENRLFRSDFAGNDEVRDEKPFIKRDHDIVDETQEMIAGPVDRVEEVRSGTWTTVRYARKKKRPIHFVFPEIE